MAKAKKVVLLVVEGVADEAALAPLVRKIVEKDETLVKICGGDVTSKIYYSNQQNVASEVGKKINEFLERNKLKKSDIHEIIHIVDTDGAYISEEYIIENTSHEFLYTEEGIITDKKEKVLLRNKNKSNAMDILLGKSTIMTIPYRVFYMSCNLDHVLYNERNLEDNKKYHRADDFADEYLDNIEGFLELMNDSALIFEGSLKDTWKEIRVGRNSLMRHSNLHLFLNDNS